jgi:hypothetical protein
LAWTNEIKGIFQINSWSKQCVSIFWNTELRMRGELTGGPADKRTF